MPRQPPGVRASWPPLADTRHGFVARRTRRPANQRPLVAAASRYWTFQTIEAALFLTMAAGLVALAFHLVQRHV